MFEKYTESALRVIFLARYEASRGGAKAIEAKHLLLGIIAEDQGDPVPDISSAVDTSATLVKTAPGRCLSSQTAAALRGRLEEPSPPAEQVPVSVDMVLAKESMTAIKAAKIQAATARITPLHLLLGLLLDSENSVSRLLSQHRITAEQVENLIRSSHQ